MLELKGLFQFMISFHPSTSKSVEENKKTNKAFPYLKPYRSYFYLMELNRNPCNVMSEESK
jgi:hypothetical protein